VTDRNDPVKRYEPNHPHADKDGYVSYPNVNVMEEMVNVLSATRSYEANLQVVNAAKEMEQKTLEILR
jgi:flagellar basal-body rod protein FlgC